MAHRPGTQLEPNKYVPSVTIAASMRAFLPLQCLHTFHLTYGARRMGAHLTDEDADA